MKKNAAPMAVLRVERKLMQKDLAERAKISTLHLLRVERGAETPSDELMERLAAVLKVNTKSLWNAWKAGRKAYLSGLKS